MNDRVDIRPFAPADEPAVVDLWKRVFAYSTPHNEPRKLIRQKLAFDPELFFVVTIDEAVVGTVMGGYDGHRGWIYSLAVQPAFRRQGIATRLTRHVEAAIAGRGCSKINLQVLPTNSDVVQFYAQLGYKVEERISMGRILPDSGAGPAEMPADA